MSTPSTCSHLKDKKVILITGGNRGIGKAICKGLLQQHPNVHVLLGSRDLNKGKQAADEIKGQNKSLPSCSLTVVQLDVTSDSSVQAAAQMVKRLGCKLYGIVNNAGVSGSTSASSREILNANYFGPRRVNNAFSSILVRPGGRVVNVSSVTAPTYLSGCLFYFEIKRKRRELHYKLANPFSLKGGVEELDSLATEALGLCKPSLGTILAVPVVLPKQHAYMLSKALLNAYTAVHSKLEPGLVVNSCCPGFIHTDLNPLLIASKTVEQGALMPINLLMAKEFKSDSDGKFFAEDKAWKLSEIPGLKSYPKPLAVVFEKLRCQQKKDNNSVGKGHTRMHTRIKTFPLTQRVPLLLLAACCLLLAAAVSAISAVGLLLTVFHVN